MTYQYDKLARLAYEIWTAIIESGASSDAILVRFILKAFR